ncbi:MAG: hypothetical protein Q8P92_02180 [Candidatus Daviesbacteria bacterium]|nr:hypothetical protein [Candidatus Daviesbacteria bacterium]
MRVNKLILSIIIFIISLPIFIWLESGFAIKSATDFVKPLIFSASLVISSVRFYKHYLLIISLTLLFLMVIFYLFWQIPTADWLGSVGIGMFTIYIIGYLPELIRKGYVEKL